MNPSKFFRLSVLSIVVFIILGSECINENDEDGFTLEEKLFFGSWVWSSTVFHGFDGFDTTYTPVQWGESVSIDIYDDKTFKRVENRKEGTEIITGNWELEGADLNVFFNDGKTQSFKIYLDSNRCSIQYEDTLWLETSRHFGAFEEIYTK